ncbi:MAG: hypothetical protein OEV06_07190 [Anaerolineae bacterium]|nr:hypothetical protein [Anaerolineae bacterium]
MKSLKRLTPTPLWNAARRLWQGLNHARQWPLAAFHPERRRSIRQLDALKDVHRGERCFILGNGPSLAKTDISLLKDEFTVGMNRVYLAFPDWGFPTSYFLSVNDLVIEQCAADILALPVPKFLSWRSRRFLPSPSEAIFLHTTYTGLGFTRDARKRLWEGATVTYIALQLAFHMGFETAILIGVDHSFKSQGQPNTTVTSSGDDPDHFDPSYFGSGFRWQLPDLEMSERAYHKAREAYRSAGRRVLDATIAGQLQVFPKVDYTSLFE